MAEPDLEQSRQRVEQVYRERTSTGDQIADWIGGIKSSLSKTTEWLAESMKSVFDPETTKAYFPAVAGLGLGVGSWLLTENFFGNSTLGLALGVASAGLLGFGAYKAFDMPPPDTNTTIVVDGPPAELIVRQRHVTPPHRTVDEQVVPAAPTTVPEINRELTTPIGITWPEIIAVETDNLKTDGRLAVTTKTVRAEYQNWEEGVRKIHQGVHDYNTYTRDVLVHHLGTFGITTQDIAIWGAVPEAPTPPKLLVGSDNLTTELNRAGKALAKRGELPGGLTEENWETQTVSTKINALREWVHQGMTTNRQTKRYFDGEGHDALELMNDTSNMSQANGHATVYSRVANQAQALFHQSGTTINITDATNLYEHAWGGLGVAPSMIIAVRDELAAYEAKWHTPNRTMLEDFAKKDGVLDDFNARMRSMQQNFNTLASQVNTQKIAILKAVGENGWKNTTEGYIVIKDLRAHEFGKNETAVTRTLSIQKQPDGKYKVTAWNEGDHRVGGWTNAPEGKDIIISDINDAEQVRKALDMAVPAGTPVLNPNLSRFGIDETQDNPAATQSAAQKAAGMGGDNMKMVEVRDNRLDYPGRVLLHGTIKDGVMTVIGYELRSNHKIAAGEAGHYIKLDSPMDVKFETREGLVALFDLIAPKSREPEMTASATPKPSSLVPSDDIQQLAGLQMRDAASGPTSIQRLPKGVTEQDNPLIKPPGGGAMV